MKNVKAESRELGIGHSINYYDKNGYFSFGYDLINNSLQLHVWSNKMDQYFSICFFVENNKMIFSSSTMEDFKRRLIFRFGPIMYSLIDKVDGYLARYKYKREAKYATEIIFQYLDAIAYYYFLGNEKKNQPIFQKVMRYSFDFFCIDYEIGDNFTLRDYDNWSADVKKKFISAEQMYIDSEVCRQENCESKQSTHCFVRSENNNKIQDCGNNLSLAIQYCKNTPDSSVIEYERTNRLLLRSFYRGTKYLVERNDRNSFDCVMEEKTDRILKIRHKLNVSHFAESYSEDKYNHWISDSECAIDNPEYETFDFCKSMLDFMDLLKTNTSINHNELNMYYTESEKDFKSFCEQYLKSIGCNHLINKITIHKCLTPIGDRMARVYYTTMKVLCNKLKSFPISATNLDNEDAFVNHSLTRTSFPERKLAYLLSKKYNVQQGQKINGLECDMLINNLFVMEYDGVQFHLKKEASDTKKTTRLINDGYIVVRIREKGLNKLNDGSVQFFIDPTDPEAIEKLLPQIDKFIEETLSSTAIAQYSLTA